MDTFRRCSGWLFLIATLAFGAGCETPAGSQFQWWSTHRLADEGTVEEHRSRFQQQGDPQSFRWLLANQLSSVRSARPTSCMTRSAIDCELVETASHTPSRLR